MNNTIKLCIKGMHCPSCEILVEGEINKIPEVSSVKSQLKSKSVELTGNFESTNSLIEKVNNLLIPFGYQATIEKQNENKNYKELLPAVIMATGIIVLFIILEKLKLSNLLNISTTSYPAIFLIGIIASVSSCAAVVGSLILSLSANLAKKDLYTNKTIWVFHTTRLVSFFILGGLIGLLGKSVAITPEISIILNLFLGIVMVTLGLNLLNIFDFTKNLQFRIPKIISKKFITKKGNNSTISSVVLGAATFFLPCGFTQSMQVFALTSKDFLTAAYIMFTFALGTLPVLLLITLSSKTFSTGKYSGLFFRTAGILVIGFGLFNLYNSLIIAQIIR